MPLSVTELLEAGIEALAHADAARLEALAAVAAQTRPPETAEEHRRAGANLTALQRMLILTRRNLRLLRGAGYRDYGPGGRLEPRI